MVVPAPTGLVQPREELDHNFLAQGEAPGDVGARGADEVGLRVVAVDGEAGAGLGEQLTEGS